ncbi:aldo/keto reductase [Candidatus Daviesbacteria bacterium]|nr:aldo/keto reductase [Candidatus Daviesbacteria bacterium]
MEYKEIGAVKLSALGIGTYGFGGGLTRDTSNDRRDIEALQYAIELGMTHIDTSEMYADGHSEELIGQAIRDFDRHSLFVATKVFQSGLTFNGVIEGCKQSLRRLGTDYVDLYLIHWPNLKIPLSETIQAMDELVRQGSARFIGVSNFSIKLLKQAQELSHHPILTDQVEYSLLVKNPESDLLPYCQKNDIFLTAYRPIGRGRIRAGVNQVLDDVAKEHNRTAVQVALNYLICQENVLVIPKAAQRHHLEENLGSMGWRLDQEDIRALQQAFQTTIAV